MISFEPDIPSALQIIINIWLYIAKTVLNNEIH